MKESHSITPVERFLLCFLYTVSVAALSIVSLEDLPAPPMFYGADKIAHFIAYGVYSILLLWGIQVEKRKGRSLILFAVMLYTTLYGVLMECLQAYFGEEMGRSFSIADMISNSLGAVISAIVFYKFWMKKNRI